MCDLMDCKNCRHLCKVDVTDYEVEKLWNEFEDVLADLQLYVEPISSLGNDDLNILLAPLW